MAPLKGFKHPAKKGQRKAGASDDSKKGYKKPLSVKNQIRSVERMLKRELPPKTKEKTLQKLQQLQKQLQTNKATELERKYAARYHKVRFFERVKLERQIKQLQREGSNGPESQQKLKQLQADLQYVLGFPKGHKYVSILKTADTPEAQIQLDKQRDELRQLARRQAADRAALAESDEGRSLGMLVTAPTQGSSEAQQPRPSASADEDDFLVPEDHIEVPTFQQSSSPDPSPSAPEGISPASSAPAKPSLHVQQGRPVQKTGKQSGPTRPKPHHPSTKAAPQAVRQKPSHAAARPKVQHAQHRKPGASGKSSVAADASSRAAAAPRAAIGAQSGRTAATLATQAHARQAAVGGPKPVPAAVQPLQPASKGIASAAKVLEKRPARTRAEGGRKRRK